MATSSTMSSPHPSKPEPNEALIEAVSQIGDRWSLLIVDALLGGPRRFGELIDGVDGLAPNILSRRLKQLEADGLVVAEPYSRRPLRHDYRLTASGEELAGVLRLLAQWAAARRGPQSAIGLAHQACGTTLEAQWYCPTCDELVATPDASDSVWI
jgi:DNA-binding HxlR family transcriptional regulator